MNKTRTLEEKYALIKEELLKTKSKDPVLIAEDIMKLGFVNMHGPEHHFLDGGAFMSAMHNAGVEFTLSEKLDELANRTFKMPGAMCGYWGICGSTASIGAVLSIIHNVGPLSNSTYYSDDMEYTSSVIKRMSEIGGPRCCKRNAFLSLSIAVDFVNKKYGIKLDSSPIVCGFSSKNNDCLKERCPFNKVHN